MKKSKTGEKAIRILGGEITKVDKAYKMNKEDFKHNIIIEKKKETAVKYPRASGIIKKNPL